MQQVLSWLFSALSLATAVAFAWRFRSRATGLLGAAAFGYWFLAGLVRRLLVYNEVRYWETSWRWAFTVGSLIAWAALLIALLELRRPPTRTTAVQDATLPDTNLAFARLGEPAVEKSRFVGSVLAGYLGMLLLVGISLGYTFGEDEPRTGLVFAVLSLLPGIFASIVWLVFLHRIWSSIQGVGARTSPARAVGFLFIPLFSLYWIFEAVWGWTKDFNRLAATQPALRRAPEGVALAYCILAIASAIPYVNFVALPVELILVVVLVSRASDSVNSLGAVAHGPAGARVNHEIPADAD